jgi:putative colanic acid biosynthesis acetyltransferase WcaF
VKPSVHIKYPWFLEIGENVWIGEGVWLDNPGVIKIGSDVCISQGAYLVTGNHNFRKTTFDFISEPIEIGDGCWICAKAVIPPGSKIDPGTVVPIGSVWKIL